MEKKQQEIKLIFRLLKEALDGTAEEIIPEGMDWQWIYEFCCFQKIENLIAYRIEKAEDGIVPDLILVKFREAKGLGLMREATQDVSLQEICRNFAENQISMIPLKGSCLKRFYPYPDNRFLTDLDILCSEKQKKQIYELMEKMGYSLYHDGEIHDVFIRKPFMTVEIHWKCSVSNEFLENYFAEIWKYVRLCEEKPYVYEMTWEDFYVYMIAHMEKHLKSSGIGIRMILDLYVFWQKLMPECDRKKIEELLERSGLLKFEQIMYEFINQCFEKETDLEERALFWHVIENGAQGTIGHIAGNRVLNKGKSNSDLSKRTLKAMFFTVIPDLSYMKRACPYLKKYPFLLPFAWIHRIVKRGVEAPERCWKILKEMFRKKETESMEKVYRESGLRE